MNETKMPSMLLATILKTQGARYWLISAWGAALVPVIGGKEALIWWLLTLGWAGWLRSRYETFIAARGEGWGRLPLVAMTSAVFWAAAPLLAWRSPGPFGAPAAWLMLASGYHLTFTQLGHAPRNAITVTLPYTAVVLYILYDLWGSPSLWAAALALGVIFGGLYFSVIYGNAAQKRIREGLEHEARLSALRYQVQPHFLFNALNSISTLVSEKRSLEAESMIDNLAEFFRFSLTAAPQDLVTLDKEISGQKLYLNVEQIRFPDRLVVEYRVDPDTADVMVPTLILQPLVENAIIHGLARSAEPVTIEVGSRIKGKVLCLWVADDARPVSPLKPGTGFGLQNVQDRLEGHFNGRSRVTSSLDHRGWRTEIEMPVLHG